MLTITLSDRSSIDQGSPISIDDDATLIALLARFRTREPGFYELAADDENVLLLGIGPDYGVAQFSSRTGEPPYLVTVGNAKKPPDEAIVFSMAGELTEIESKRCLPMTEITTIAEYFRKTGKRHPNFLWELA